METYAASLTDDGLVREYVGRYDVVRTVVLGLLASSIWFVVIPMPDDIWCIAVKAEAGRTLVTFVDNARRED